MVSVKSNAKKKTLLGYELTSRQNVIINYLVPSVCSCLLYTFIIASDIAVIFSHYKNGDPVWASLTLFFMYLPLLGSFVIIVSNWELWPEFDGCGWKNTKWFWMKTLEHLYFPVWSMWRFAERIFWSIEGMRAQDDESISEATSIVDAPRSIELYMFLQSYLHALPQILLQLFILIRHNADIDRQTEKAQILSMVLNLAKLSMTTTYYQRFKSQKLTGKQYPWYKIYKASAPPSEVVLRRSDFSQARSVVEGRVNTSNLEESYDIEPLTLAQRRRSSDIYLEPSTSFSDENSRRQTLLETDFDNTVTTKATIVGETSKNDDLKTLEKTTVLRETSVLDGPKRILYREEGVSEPDFNISRVVYVKGLEDDDLAGRLIAFCWWFGFLLARILAISVFAYFFLKESLWLVGSHFVLVLAFLLYDVRTDEVKRAKALFFLFLGLVYIFCIIEFKIRFKKATFIYYGFFALVFAENFVMCMIWFLGQMESIENDFWFRYIFYIVVMCSITSFSSMVFYFTVNKPPKVVVQAQTVAK